MHYCRSLVAQGLDGPLFEAVMAQLKAKPITGKTGTLVDATSALVEKVPIAPACVNNGHAGPDAVPDHPGEVVADSAPRVPHFGDAVPARGRIPRVIATSMWGRNGAETHAHLDAWNQPPHRVRARIENIFRARKCSYSLRRMRWRGLATAAVQVHLTAIAYNLKRTLSIVFTAR